MRAHVELSDSERKILVTLEPEEREVLLEQMLATVREELEWEVAVERAHQAAAASAQAAATAVVPLPSQPPPRSLPTMAASSSSRTPTPPPLPPRALPPLPRRTAPPTTPGYAWSSSSRRAAR